MNAKAVIIVNHKAELALMAPDGISRPAVRAFLASILRSDQRLNAIAEERAKTMQQITHKALVGATWKSTLRSPATKPMAANGMANTVWLNLMRDKYLDMVRSIEPQR